MSRPSTNCDPEDLHRLHHRRADHRLTDALHEALDDAGNALTVAQHFAGEGERQGGDIDQRRVGAIEMLVPARRGDLVLDQVVDGGRVGHAQQRLGKAHERDALVRRQRILGEEGFQHAGRLRGAHLVDQPRGLHADGAAIALATGRRRPPAGRRPRPRRRGWRSGCGCAVRQDRPSLPPVPGLHGWLICVGKM